MFAAMVNELHQLLRAATGRKAQPTGAIFDSRALQSSPKSGARAGYDGAKQRKGGKIHAAVVTLGHLLALRVTPASDQDRAQAADLAAQVQDVGERRVEVAFVDQGYCGDQPLEAAAEQGIRLEVVNLQEVRKGFVLLLRR